MLPVGRQARFAVVDQRVQIHAAIPVGGEVTDFAVGQHTLRTETVVWLHGNSRVVIRKQWCGNVTTYVIDKEVKQIDTIPTGIYESVARKSKLLSS